MLLIYRNNRKRFGYWKGFDNVRGEHRLDKDTHDLKLWPANLKVVPDDGNETAYDDCYMNLYADGILGLSQNSLTRRCHIRPCNYTVLWSV